MVTPDIVRRYRWFRRAGVGGVVGSDAQQCLALARAEAWRIASGLEVRHDAEHEPWDGEGPAPAYLLSVSLWRSCDEHGAACRHAQCLASLGMVGVDSLGDPYLRIVAAELASEVCHG